MPVAFELRRYAIPNLGFYSKKVIQIYGAVWDGGAGWTGLCKSVLDESILPLVKAAVEAALCP